MPAFITDPADIEAYTSAGWWGASTGYELVKHWAADRPDDVAYGWGDARLTWAQYLDLVHSIAARLAAFTLDRGDRVLVFLPDGGAVHAAFVACEASGLVAVGVGWRSGEAELAHLTRRTGAQAAISTTATRIGRGHELLDRLALIDRVLIDDLETRPTVDDGPTAALRHKPIDASELWLLNSTSGTTGLPKCVIQTQNRWGYFHQLAMRFGKLATDEVWMSVVPAPFGFGLWTSHVSPSIEGAPCFVQERFDPRAALATIERERVTVLCAVSSQFVMLLNEHTTEDLSSLKVMFTGGEAISHERALEFEARTNCTILNFYGSNETGVLSGTTVDDPIDVRLTTGGRCVDEMQVRLYELDGRRIDGDRGRGQPACRGPALSPGYWDDQDADAELFTDDGWMLMGDIVTIDDDNYIRVVGRTSDFIIRGGKNISAAAVEAECLTHPAIDLCAAVPVPSDRLGEQVGLFVQLSNANSALELEALKAHLADRGISKEWWPEHLFVLNELPRSSGGKVAKGELRKLAAP